MVTRREVFYLKADIGLEDDFLRALPGLAPQIPISGARRAFERTGRHVQSIVPGTVVGTFHEIFFVVDDSGVDWVLKANRLSAWFSDQSPVRELAVSELLTQHNMAHGKVILSDCSRRSVDFDFEVMERVDGDSLRRLDDDDQIVERNQPAVARYLRRLHEIPGEYFGLVDDESDVLPSRSARGWSGYLLTRLDDHLAILANARVISPAAGASIAETIRHGAPLLGVDEPRLLHGDCGPHNIVLGERGQVCMIDWEDALFGDPLFDVALWATFNPARRWEGFFAAYFDQPWTPNGAFWLYFLRISLAKSVVRLRFGYRDIPGREPSVNRIDRAMAALRIIEK